MALEKTVSISITTSEDNKIGLSREDDRLVLTIMDGDGRAWDTASIFEEDLRSLVKDLFPSARKGVARGPRKPKVATTNGQQAGTSANV